MSKFNQDWLQQYRRNPRGSNTLYKNYSNPMGVDANYTANDLGPNPLVQSMFAQGEQRGIPAGQQAGKDYLLSFTPEHMKNMPLNEILGAVNKSYDDNKRLQAQQQEAALNAQRLEAERQARVIPLPNTSGWSSSDLGYYRGLLNDDKDLENFSGKGSYTGRFERGTSPWNAMVALQSSPLWTSIARPELRQMAKQIFEKYRKWY